MNRYTYSVTKDVEVLAENGHEALAAVVLGDFENEAVTNIEFQYKETEPLFGEDFPTETAGGTACQELQSVDVEEVEGQEIYEAGFSDGYDLGQIDERARIHEALVDPQQD